MTAERRTRPEEAREIGDQIGVDWDRFDLEQFRAGMDVEYEHGGHDPQTDVTGDDPVITGKIAADLVFYTLAIIGYEVSQARVAPAHLG